MVVFPNCKINLGLNVTQRRNDGFHDIETVFYPLRWCDALEILKVEEPDRSLQFSTSGINIPGKSEANLCIQAYELLKRSFPRLSPVRMHLHKTVPAGAGLGGGSADAAFTLQLLNKLFDVGLSNENLMTYALELGSDCPFFIVNKPCFATGRGEVLQEIDLDLSGYKVMMVNPGIHITTTEAFSMVSTASHSKSIMQVIQRPIETWKNELKNDFEIPVFEKYAEISKIKDELYSAGAVYASMSGSGSTVYGIFRRESNVSLPSASPYLVKQFSAKTPV